MENLEKNLKRTFSTWQTSIQGIRYISDLNQFLWTLDQNENFFETEFNNKEQSLEKYISQNDTELTENTKLFEDLQKQNIATNMTKQLAIFQQFHKQKLIR